MTTVSNVGIWYNLLQTVNPMATINTIEDLIRILDENPEWAEALRSRLLTQELLELPARFAEYARTNDQRMAAIDRRFEAIDRQFDTVNAHLRVLDRRMERFEVDMARFRSRHASEMLSPNPPKGYDMAGQIRDKRRRERTVGVEPDRFARVGGLTAPEGGC